MRKAAPPVPDPEVGYRELVRRWLRTFGPGTEDDLVSRTEPARDHHGVRPPGPLGEVGGGGAEGGAASDGLTIARWRKS